MKQLQQSSCLHILFTCGVKSVKQTAFPSLFGEADLELLYLLPELTDHGDV